MLQSSIIKFSTVIIAFATLAQTEPWIANYNRHLNLDSQKHKRSFSNNKTDIKDVSVNWKTNCTGTDCISFYQELLQKIDEDIDPCLSPYLYACNNLSDSFDTHQDFNEKMKQSIISELKETLTKEPNEKDSKSLSIEKRLFQDCLNFNSSYDNLAQLVQSSGNYSWLTLDELTSPGDYAFFDISVIQNFTLRDTPIIKLQPPLKNSEFIRNLKISVQILRQSMMKKMYDFDYNNNNDDPQYEEFEAKYWGSVEPLNNFLNMVIKKRPERQGILTSVGTWSDVFKKYSRNNSEAEIDWIHVFNTTFNAVGRSINETDLLFVQSPEYFKEFAEFLRKTWKRHLELIVRAKPIAENLRYVNWTLVQKRSPKLNKLTFCLDEIKHYGVSDSILNKEEKKNKYYPRIQKVLSEIVKVIDTKISNSHEKLEVFKKSLQEQLKVATEDLINDFWSKEEVSNYYGDFKLNNNHLSNIIRYRDMLKLTILKRLRDNSKFLGLIVKTGHHNYDAGVSFTQCDRYAFLPKLPLTPLSFINNDLQNIQGKLLMNFVIAMSKNLTFKELLFSTYGVDAAFDLYSMLLHNPGMNRIKNIRMQCVYPLYEGDILPQTDEWLLNTVKLFYSMEIAFEAMGGSDSHSEIIQLPDGKSISSSRLFFLIYMNTNCHPEYDQVLGLVTLKSREFASTYGCHESLDIPTVIKCEKPPF